MAFQVKHIPKNADGSYKRTFKANGVTYKILSPDDGIGILRWSLMSKMSSVLGYGADVKTQLDNIKKVRTIVGEVLKGKGDILEVGVHLKAMEDGIRRENNLRYHYAFFTATLFIVRDGEDLTEYSQDDAQGKIDDWNAENLDAADFFFLVLNELPRFLNPLNRTSPSKAGA
jgi:hypothetical protein